MDRERLTRLLGEPGRVAREDLGDLKALTERYPWFSGAQLLRVAGEQAAGDVLFNETLNSATAHLPSRAVLFDLVEQRDQQPVQPRPEPRVVHLPVREPVRVIAPELPPVIEEEENATEEAVVPVAPSQHTTVPHTATTDEDEEQLDRQIMEAALANAYDLTWQEPAPAVQPANPAGTPEPTPVERTTVASPASSEASGTFPTGQTVIREAITSSSRMRFTAWLDAAEPTLSVEPPSSSTPPPAAQDWIRGTPAGPTEPTSPVKSLETRELIDRFMQYQTPEPAHKAEFFTPQQAAKRSLDDTAGLVTETLARIYEKQGNLSKAIETYRRLALKYPHKSGYFAALQKSLEEQLNK